MKVAFVHDWLVTYRGGEKVLEAMLALYPDAPVYTLFYDPKNMPEGICQRNIIYPKFLARFRRFKKILLPIFPAVMEAFPLEKFDLVISTSSCVAKGVLTAPDAKHLCYLHSPMRYVWDMRSQYLASLPNIPFVRAIFHMLSSRLRVWDTASAARVDRFLVNSRFVGQRVRKYYGADYTVLPPPIRTRELVQATAKKPYFLAAGALVGYKRFDLAIEATAKAQVDLVIAGDGPEYSRLRRLAGGHVRFERNPCNTRFIELLGEAQALLFPGIEDFGMVAVEAMGCGTPVIAFEGGGALDFIEPGKTGAFFSEPTAESLCRAIEDFDGEAYDPRLLREFAERFDEGHFLIRLQEQIDQLLGEHL